MPPFNALLREIDEAGAKLDATLSSLKADPLFPRDDDSQPEPDIGPEGVTALVALEAEHLGLAVSARVAAGFATALIVATECDLATNTEEIV